jgi:hypothetical protein
MSLEVRFKENVMGKKIAGWILLLLGIGWTICFTIIIVQGGVLSDRGLILQLWILASGPIVAWWGWSWLHPKKKVE